MISIVELEISEIEQEFIFWTELSKMAIVCHQTNSIGLISGRHVKRFFGFFLLNAWTSNYWVVYISVVTVLEFHSVADEIQ